jgi:hypothetical protein
MYLKFSDYWWIDLPCFMAFFILLMSVSLTTLINAELGLFHIVGYDPFLIIWIAPIIEESFKFLMLALWTPLAIAFTAFFSTVEAFRYITYGIDKYGDIPAIFYIMRGICVGVHFLTLACQLFGFHMYYKYKMWVYLLLGYVSAIFIHFEWNIAAGQFVLVGVRYVYDTTTKILGT